MLPVAVRWYSRDVPYLSGNDRRTQLTEIPSEDVEPLDDIYDLDAYVLGMQRNDTEEYAARLAKVKGAIKGRTDVYEFVSKLPNFDRRKDIMCVNVVKRKPRSPRARLPMVLTYHILPAIPRRRTM